MIGLNQTKVDKPKTPLRNRLDIAVHDTGEDGDKGYEFKKYAHLLSENQWLHIFKDVERMTKEQRRKQPKEYGYDLSETPSTD